MVTRPKGFFLVGIVAVLLGAALPPAPAVQVVWSYSDRDACPSLALDPDGLTVASGTRVARLRTADGTPAWSIDHGFTVSRLAADRARVWVAGGALRCLRASDGATLWRRDLPGHAVRLLDRDDEGVTIGTSAGRVARYSREEGQLLWSFDFGATEVLALTSDASAVYAAHRGRVVGLDKAGGALLWTASFAMPVADLAVDSGALYGGFSDAVRALSTVNGAVMWIHVSPSPVHHVAVADGDVFAAGRTSGLVRRLDAATGELQWSFEHGGGVFALEAVADGVLVGGDPAGVGPASLRRLSRQEGVPLWTFNHGRRILAVAPDGADVYAGGEVAADGAVARRLRAENPNSPPVADAGSDQVVEAVLGGVASVTLDGSRSYDPDGDPLTYLWSGSFGSAPGMTGTLKLGLGRHDILLTVDDGRGGTGADRVTVFVVDTEPPVVTSVSATPSSLWPANHAMVAVEVTVSALDGSDPMPLSRIVEVSSNEPALGRGDGRTASDWEITGALSLRLRAERSGRGTGRVYTVVVETQDRSGNSVRASVRVGVAHDRRP